MTFQILREPTEAWERFVLQQGGTLFGRLVWSRILGEGLGGRPLWFVFKDGAEIVGGLSGVLLGYGGIRLLYGSIPYGGYLGDLSAFDSFMESFLTKTEFADVIYISPPGMENGPDYVRYFEASREVATRIDLLGKSSTELCSACAPSVRQSLNKGERLGLSVRQCRDRTSFLLAHRLYLQTMRRNNAIARYPQRWFGAIHDHLVMTGEACVYLVFSGDVPISATVVVDSRQVRHLLHSGASTEHLSLRANDLIVWEIIKDAAQEGKESVDLMFSDPADTALIDWKEKFGGQSLALNKYRRINSPFKHALWERAKKVAPLLGRFRLSSGVGPA